MKWSTVILVVFVGAGFIAAGTYVQRTRRCFLGAALVFAGCVVVAHLIPFLIFPWPLLAQMQGSRYVHVLSIREAWCYDAVEWAIATIAFAWMVKRIRAVWLVPLALAMIAIVAVGVQVAARASGMVFYWDLWH